MSAKAEKTFLELQKLLSAGAIVTKKKLRRVFTEYNDSTKRQILKSRNIAAKTKELEKEMGFDVELLKQLRESNGQLLKNEANLVKLSRELAAQQNKMKVEELRMMEDFEKQKAQLSAEFQARLEAVSARVEAIQSERTQLVETEDGLKKEIGVLISRFDAEERKEKKALTDSSMTGGGCGEEYEERMRELRESGDMAHEDYRARAAIAIQDTAVYSALLTRQAVAFTELQNQVQHKNDELRGQQEEMKALIDSINEEEGRKKALEFVAAENAVMLERARAARDISVKALETIRARREKIEQLAALTL